MTVTCQRYFVFLKAAENRSLAFDEANLVDDIVKSHLLQEILREGGSMTLRIPSTCPKLHRSKNVRLHFFSIIIDYFWLRKLPHQPDEGSEASFSKEATFS